MITFFTICTIIVLICTHIAAFSAGKVKAYDESIEIITRKFKEFL